ncbi:2Fe-2S iron-sulfur cluster-binding protein [Cupriavidus gilardii]|uniref:2Fe-2S iron-sulfur cluster-binding protein n=1 Tax=Cupriavidus gilardii TaxID=82541 RepID=A0ABY4VTB2_9BURK|nr:2Fe-2S iron-sulfur cluster-binding protein [Cupriavidus gilardii]USE78593.1 2Fe-2S iron-sulfur cluster-binding protein [Cupriavidus gilardii]
MLSLTIDGKAVSASRGQTVLQAARLHGIEIPTLCHHPDLSPVGSCRLCVVEIVGDAPFATACMLPVRENMAVRTSTPAIVQARRAVLEMLLVRYDDEAQPETNSEFMRWVRQYGARRPALPQTPARFAADTDPHPFIRVDLNKCILCTRCVRACADVQGRFVWGVAGRGEAAHIVAGSTPPCWKPAASHAALARRSVPPERWPTEMRCNNKAPIERSQRSAPIAAWVVAWTSMYGKRRSYA